MLRDEQRAGVDVRAPLLRRGGLVRARGVLLYVVALLGLRWGGRGAPRGGAVSRRKRSEAIGRECRNCRACRCVYLFASKRERDDASPVATDAAERGRDDGPPRRGTRRMGSRGAASACVSWRTRASCAVRVCERALRDSAEIPSEMGIKFFGSFRDETRETTSARLVVVTAHTTRSARASPRKRARSAGSPSR